MSCSQLITKHKELPQQTNQQHCNRQNRDSLFFSTKNAYVSILKKTIYDTMTLGRTGQKYWTVKPDLDYRIIFTLNKTITLNKEQGREKALNEQALCALLCQSFSTL